MHRIDNDTAVNVMPAMRPIGPVPNGYFSQGDPTTDTPPTRLDADWLNSIMLELCNVVTGADILLDKNNQTQLYSAIYKLIFGVLPSGDATVLDSPLAANLELLALVGANLGLTGEDINLSGANVRLNADFKLGNQSSINKISNAAFTNSDNIVPTQAAAKAFIDGLDLSTLTPFMSDITISAFIPDTFAPGSGNKDMGYILGVPIVALRAATLKDVRINWARVSASLPEITAAFTILKNGTPTSMTVTASGNTTGKITITGSISLSANDTYALRVNVGGAANLSRVRWSALLEAT